MVIINWMAVILFLGTSTTLLLNRDWRWSLGIMAVQYVGVFWLVQLTWPIGMAAVKLITGWMVCAVIGMAKVGSPPTSGRESSWPEGRTFRILAAGLIVLVTAAFAPMLTNWLGVINLPRAWGGILLMGMGLLHLGMTSQPLRVMLGLLTVMAGFEIIYAAVENSTLVAALLTIINLGMALVGAYLLGISPKEDSA